MTRPERRKREGGKAARGCSGKPGTGVMRTRVEMSFWQGYDNGRAVPRRLLVLSQMSENFVHQFGVKEHLRPGSFGPGTDQCRLGRGKPC